MRNHVEVEKAIRAAAARAKQGRSELERTGTHYAAMDDDVDFYCDTTRDALGRPAATVADLKAKVRLFAEWLSFDGEHIVHSPDVLSDMLAGLASIGADLDRITAA